MELGLQGLIVLAFDLEFGLKLFHQEIEARDFGAEFGGVRARGARRGWSGRLRGV